MTESFSIIKTDWLTHGAELTQVRETVFVKEQHVPIEMELDEFDATATHFLALDERNNPIGTARLLANGHIGRMAVLKSWRSRGIGSALLKTIIKEARSQNIHLLILNAQTTAIAFYRRYAFIEEGEVFMDAGIPHQKMTRTC